MWMMIYFFNLAYCFLAVFPIRSWLKSAFGDSPNLDKLANEFDLNIFMDLLRENASITSVAFPLIFIAVILYFLWINFFIGGVLKSYAEDRFNMSNFFAASIRYFFQNVRLSVYIILFYALVLVLAFMFFKKDGLHVLDIEDENNLIFRFQYLTTIIFTLAFFIGIFKELVRVDIVRYNRQWFPKSMVYAFWNMLKPDNLLLAFINLIFLVLVVVLHYLIVRSAFLNDHFILMIIISQLLLIFRMILKITRLGSFYKLNVNQDI